MTRTPAQALAVARGRVGQTVPVGMCLQITRGYYGIPQRYGDAATAWQHATGKHGGAPPPGMPVFYTGGRHGHIAISAGGGYVISSDSPTTGKIGTVPLDWPTRRWGYRYAGYATGFNGVAIPQAAAPAVVPPPALPARPGIVLAELHYGMRSESVRTLQKALNSHHLAGGATIPTTGYFGDVTAAEVVKCQVQHHFGHDPIKTAYVGANQAKHLGLI